MLLAGSGVQQTQKVIGQLSQVKCEKQNKLPQRKLEYCLLQLSVQADSRFCF
jgi:hypothetical protein